MMANPFRGRRVITNSVAMMAANIGTMVIGLLMLPLIIPVMGVRGYGIWVIISGLTTYFSVLDMGSGGAFVSQIAKFLDPFDAVAIRQIITVGLYSYGFLAIVLGPVAWVVSTHLVPWFHIASGARTQAVGVFWLVYFALFFGLATNSVGSLISAKEWIRWQSGVRIEAQLINYGLVLVGLYGHLGLYAFALGLWGSALWLGLRFYRKAGQFMNGPVLCRPRDVSWSVVRSLLAFGGWLQINNVANQIIYETDRVLAGLYAGLGTVTVYQVNYKLANVIRRLPLSLMGAFLPAASRLPSESDVLKTAYIDASRYLALLSFALGGGLWAALPLLMKGWMGQGFHQEDLIFLLLLGSYWASNLTGIGTTVLRAMLRPQLTSYYTLLTAVVKLALSLWWAPRYGILGILAGSLVGSVIGTVYWTAVLLKVLNLSWRQALWDWLGPLLATTLPIMWIGQQLASAVVGDLARWQAGLMAVFEFSGVLGAIVGILCFTGFFNDRDARRLDQILPSYLHSLSHRIFRIPRM